jgi:hypothetical protein
MEATIRGLLIGLVMLVISLVLVAALASILQVRVN